MFEEPSNNQYTFGDDTHIDGDFVVGEKVVHIHPPPAPRLPLEKPGRAAHFTGREGQLQQLLEALQPGAVVTLCGPGGIGKSALAAEAVWVLAPAGEPPERFPQGILFHTFYQQPQAELAFEKIATIFGEEPRPTPQEAARRALAGRTALLVLDGAEACDDLPAVLAVRGGCSVLVTSRRRSDAPEGWLDVPALDEAAAVSLLSAFAGKIETGFAAEISSLCARLPLALRLAGRYMAATHEEPQAYLRWLLESPLNALDWKQREQDSVPLLMEHSLQQVNDNAQEALSVAGALAFSPFSLEPLQATLDMSEPALRKALGELVDYGLLLRGENGWSIGHALVHAYARQAIPLEKDRFGRLGGYYYRFAKQERKSGLEGYPRLDAVRPHVLEVAQACLVQGLTVEVVNLARGMDSYLDSQGHWVQRLALLELALKAARLDRNHQLNEGQFLNQIGNTYVDLGDTKQAIRFFEEGLEKAREDSNPRLEGSLLGNLGIAYQYLGKTKKAIEYQQLALAKARETGDKELEGDTLGNLGMSYLNLGQVRKAIQELELALSINRQNSNRSGEGTVLSNLGIAYTHLGETDTSIKYYRQALAIARKTGNKSDISVRLANLGSSFTEMGKLRRGLKLQQQALAIAREIGDRRSEGAILGMLGSACADQGELIKAIEHFELGLKIAREIGDLLGESHLLSNLGGAYSTLGEIDKAIEYLELAVEISRQTGDLRGEGTDLSNLGTMYEKLGQFDKARPFWEKALPIMQYIEDPRAEDLAQALEQLPK